MRFAYEISITRLGSNIYSFPLRQRLSNMIASDDGPILKGVFQPTVIYLSEIPKGPLEKLIPSYEPLGQKYLFEVHGTTVDSEARIILTSVPVYSISATGEVLPWEPISCKPIY